MAVVLISAKKVTNMKQVKKIKKEYEGNEAASTENKPQHSRKKLTIAKIYCPKGRLTCKDNYLIYKFTFSVSFLMAFGLECPTSYNASQFYTGILPSLVVRNLYRSVFQVTSHLMWSSRPDACSGSVPS